MADFDRFDRRRYPVVPVRQGYRDWQPTYEATVEDSMDLALLEAVRDVPWDRIDRAADLGCGSGRTGAWLRRRGVASVDGVDLTPEMLAQAADKGCYAELVEGDVRDCPLESGSYGLVTCCLVDEHLPELDALYSQSARLLEPGGWLVLVGYHPFFIMASGMPTHFDHPDGRAVAIETHVHLLGEHVAAGRAAELSLVELHERLIDDEWVRLKPQWSRYRDWPLSFCAVWRREPPPR